MNSARVSPTRWGETWIIPDRSIADNLVSCWSFQSAVSSEPVHPRTHACERNGPAELTARDRWCRGRSASRTQQQNSTLDSARWHSQRRRHSTFGLHLVLDQAPAQALVQTQAGLVRVQASGAPYCERASAIDSLPRRGALCSIRLRRARMLGSHTRTDRQTHSHLGSDARDVLRMHVLRVCVFPHIGTSERDGSHFRSRPASNESSEDGLQRYTSDRATSATCCP